MHNDSTDQHDQTVDEAGSDSELIIVYEESKPAKITVSNYLMKSYINEALLPNMRRLSQCPMFNHLRSLANTRNTLHESKLNQELHELYEWNIRQPKFQVYDNVKFYNEPDDTDLWPMRDI